MSGQKTILITGASQGIGAGLVKEFLDKSRNVVGTSRRISKTTSFDQTARLELVDGDVADPATAERVAHRAVDRFSSIDALVKNAGIFFRKPFLQFKIEDFRQLSATNIEGFVHFTKQAIRQMLLHNYGGSVVTIRSSLTDHPIAGVAASLPMITMGGLNASTKNLALEFARENIRVNALSPGVVDTPLHAESPKNHLNALSRIGTITVAGDRKRRRRSDGIRQPYREGAACRQRRTVIRVRRPIPWYNVLEVEPLLDSIIFRRVVFRPVN